LTLTVVGGSGSSKEFMDGDLMSSGLTVSDVSARTIENSERALTNTPYSMPGYVLPYFDITGRLKPFYRVKLADRDTKYRQPTDSLNHIYFPRGLASLLERSRYVIITEGEKKAALAVKLGFPTCALGGIYSWRNRTLTLSGDAALTKANNSLQVKLPAADAHPHEEFDSPVAVGFTELLDTIIAKSLQVLILFDSGPDGVEPEVQRAAANLGYELRFRGVPFERIRQCILPNEASPPMTKVGLDDFLLQQGDLAFRELTGQVLEARTAFPQHPNVREYVNRKLQRTKISRKELQGLAMAILCDLDTRGIRLRDPSGLTYYFDRPSKRLLLSAWANGRDPQYDAPFTQYLYREYGISLADSRLLVWLGTQFSGENPIEEVSPQRVIARVSQDDDCIYYQISDSEFAEVNGNGTTGGIKIHDNGTANILFDSDQCEPLNKRTLLAEFARQNAEENLTLPCYWANALSQVRLRDRDKSRITTALLYYLSPWLHRWRGLQLPVELVVGESGSGKSTLCELRLGILTGRPYLRNSPSELRDWYASIAATGGLLITDNVQLRDAALRQKMSDELCRITTESEPYIEQRRLYTNVGLLRIPARCTFAFTSIAQPFVNADLLQRAWILELDKSIDQGDDGVIRYDSDWRQAQLAKYGGREAWVAHHLVVVHRFLRLARTQWSSTYSAKHRLINFEQALHLMAQVFGIPYTWMPDFLVSKTDDAISEADWVLEGLQAFAVEHATPALRGKRFRINLISEWCAEQEEYAKCDMLVNPRRLGKYLSAHKSSVLHMTGIGEAGKESNRLAYSIRGKPIPPRTL
jgi:hypothetical protein